MRDGRPIQGYLLKVFLMKVAKKEIRNAYHAVCSIPYLMNYDVNWHPPATDMVHWRDDLEQQQNSSNALTHHCYIFPSQGILRTVGSLRIKLLCRLVLKNTGVVNV